VKKVFLYIKENFFHAFLCITTGESNCYLEIAVAISFYRKTFWLEAEDVY